MPKQLLQVRLDGPPKTERKRAVVQTCRGKIVSRDTTYTAAEAPTYTIELDGHILMDGVTLDQLFNFVTPAELEAFEHSLFKADIALRRQLFEQRRAARQTPKRLGPAVRSRSVTPQPPVRTTEIGTGTGTETGIGTGTGTETGTETSESESTDTLAVNIGPKADRDGESSSSRRPRPSYTHLYKQDLPRPIRQDGPRSIKRVRTRDRQSHPVKRPASAAKLQVALPGPRQSKSRTTASTIQDSDTSEPELGTETELKARTGTQPRLETLNQEPAHVLKGVSRQSAGVAVDPARLKSPARHTGRAGLAAIPDISPLQPQPLSHDRVRHTLQDAHSTHHAADDQPEQDGQDDDQLSDDTYEIEDILSHHYSDPKTHLPEFGTKPIILYQVAWVGFQDTTWEPESSFADPALLEEYWAEVRRKQTARLSGIKTAR